MTRKRGATKRYRVYYTLLLVDRRDPRRTYSQLVTTRDFDIDARIEYGYLREELLERLERLGLGALTDRDATGFTYHELRTRVAFHFTLLSSIPAKAPVIELASYRARKGQFA